MSRKPILLAALLLLSVTGFQQARAQADDDQKFEVGGQFSLIRLPTYTPNPGLIVCGVLPCPPSLFFGENRTKNEPGFGGRVGYNLNRYFAVEAEANFFPGDSEVDGGSKTQVVGGAKVGKRFDKFGVFGKARPGFVRLSRGDYRVVGTCVTIFPAPIGCFESEPKTNFALDLGGVVEFYPSKKTILRFDAGDTMIFFGDRRVVLADDNVPPRLTVSPRGSETTHNLQISAGFGFRF